MAAPATVIAKVAWGMPAAGSQKLLGNRSDLALKAPSTVLSVAVIGQCPDTFADTSDGQVASHIYDVADADRRGRHHIRAQPCAVHEQLEHLRLCQSSRS